MARTIWKGNISFGLVEIPVGLYTATKSSEDLSFSLLDKRDFSPIGYRKVNKRTGEEVAKDDVVRAYEVEDDHYVVVTDEDFAQANVEATHTIDIIGFVERDVIDARFFDKPYYVGPTRRGSKAYALLRETLRRTGKIGLAKVVIRSRQYLGAVIPHDNVLVLEVLRYGHELRQPDELELPGEDLEGLGVREAEVRMAEQLVDQLSTDFRPDEFRDEYRDDLLAMIHRKAESGDMAAVAQPVPEAEEEAGGEVVDIMTLLKRSVARAGGQAEAGQGAASEEEKPKKRKKAKG